MANDSKTLELQIRIAAQEALKTVSSIKGELKGLADEAKKFESSGSLSLRNSFKEAEKQSTTLAKKLGNNGGLSGEFGDLSDIARQLPGPLGQAAQGLTGIINPATLAAGGIAAAGAAFVQFSKDALASYGSYEMVQKNLEQVMGSAEAATSVFKEAKDFAANTSFNVPGVAQAVAQLKQARVATDELMSTVEMLGNISGGNMDRFQRIAYNYTQILNNGSATQRDIREFSNALVPINAELQKMGVTGTASANDVKQALQNMTREGGIFFNALNNQSDTLVMKTEAMKEAWEGFKAAWADTSGLADWWKGVIDDLTESIKNQTETMERNAEVRAILEKQTAGTASVVDDYQLLGTRIEQEKNIIQQYEDMKNSLDSSIRTTYLENKTAFDEEIRRGQEQIRILEAEKSAIQSVVDGINARKQASEDWQKVLEDSGLAYTTLQGQIAEAYEKTEIGRKEALESEIELWKERLDAAHKQGFDKWGNETDNASASYFLDVGISEQEISQINTIIESLAASLNKAGKEMDDINAKAARWKENWADIWGQSQAQDDPFYNIETERSKTLVDADNNYIRSANQETIDQINAYYDSQRSDVIRQLADEEARLQRELTETKVDDLAYELQTALEAIDTLEAQRIIAAGNSEAEIAVIRERFAEFREDTELNFNIKMEEASLEEATAAFAEAKSAVKDWQTTLFDNLSQGLMDLELFGSEASIILGELAGQLIELSASAALTGFEEFGRALGEGKDAAESMEAALTAMAEQILQQLPMMFLQAGLQLIANGQWPLGLGFIAAAGASAFVSGYVDGAQSSASKNAQGGVFDEYGKATRAFASGGTFTNQIVSSPTYFRHGGGLGLMGEAGPEAIMPLKRMSNGNLGVEAGMPGGASSGTQVIVNIINNSGVEVQQEEKTDSNGNKQLDVIIGGMVNNHIASGKADRVMGARYGLRSGGV